MSEKNKELLKNLKILTKKYFELKEKNPEDFLIDLDKTEEYKEVISILNLDKFANELFYKKLLKDDFDIYIGSPQEIVDDFLNKINEKSKKYDDEIFNKIYNSFENFLYGNFLEADHIICLYNYYQTMPILSLSPQINIRKSTVKEKKEELQDNPSSFTVSSLLYDFVIEVKTKVKKEISDDKSISLHPRLEEYNKITNIFDIVLNSLRVLKKSSVFLSNRNITEVNAFSSQSQVTSISTNFKPIFVGDIFRVNEEESDKLKKVFNFINNNIDEKRLRIAIARLNDGITRDSLIDMLIDYMIGLEAIYLPDGNEELSYRLAMRIAYNVESEFEKRKQLFNDVKKYYNKRSKGVHGNISDLTIEDVDKVEEILRKSILLWKDNASIFESKNLTYNFFS